MKQESIEEIAERIANEYIENGFMLKTRRARCKAAIVKALRNERERAIKVLNDARHEGCTDLRELIARIRG